MSRSLTLFFRLVVACVVIVTLVHLICDITNYEKKGAYHLDHRVCLADLDGKLLDYTLLLEIPLFPAELLSRSSTFPFSLLKPPKSRIS